MGEGEDKMAITLNEFICFVNIQYSSGGKHLKLNILHPIGILKTMLVCFVVGGTGFESLVRLGQACASEKQKEKIHMSLLSRMLEVTYICFRLNKFFWRNRGDERSRHDSDKRNLLRWMYDNEVSTFKNSAHCTFHCRSFVRGFPERMGRARVASLVYLSPVRVPTAIGNKWGAVFTLGSLVALLCVLLGRIPDLCTRKPAL